MRFLFSILFLFTANFVSAQNTKPHQSFQIGKIEEIHSAILNETRTLNIYLPAGYSVDTLKACPVIYLLDGSANEDFIHIAGLVQFLTMIEKMP
ncbi:MAG: alpha/beta hydrolase, partial [Sphingobacteriales bacterium]